ncbi:hypothetical protein ASE27_10230 [Oerskovia sp. Root918]|uniref:hypothetical protein n=1 Tax=Oerskovia sp. Root918 TaxID=1736607 RepID=UPI0006F93410|nr:hypothetical protein [Oerskovia sp. Root918]KRD36824.1 hypothetical protein ASE27_10230 [Oerskovia sp. Root918]
MSTDDLTARARRFAAGFIADLDIATALVSELADEVDRLRAEADRYRTLWDRHGKNDLLAERDAARAALGRMTELLTLWARLASQQANLGDVVHDLTRALEGEP